MPQFDAAGIVEGLDCKLKPYTDFDGTITEPSDLQIGVFLAGLQQIMREDRDRLRRGQEVDVTDPEQVMQAIDAMDPAQFERTAGALAELHAALCSGSPTAEQILAVPPRRRVLFFNWLQTEVLNPEAVTPAGNAQVRTLRQRAAG